MHRHPTKWIDPVTGMPKKISIFRCVCGKAAFTSRKAARRHMRNNFPSEAMQVYRCSRGPFEVWHFGHPWGHERTA